MRRTVPPERRRSGSRRVRCHERLLHPVSHGFPGRPGQGTGGRSPGPLLGLLRRVLGAPRGGDGGTTGPGTGAGPRRADRSGTEPRSGRPGRAGAGDTTNLGTVAGSTGGTPTPAQYAPTTGGFPAVCGTAVGPDGPFLPPGEPSGACLRPSAGGTSTSAPVDAGASRRGAVRSARPNGPGCAPAEASHQSVPVPGPRSAGSSAGSGIGERYRRLSPRQAA